MGAAGDCSAAMPLAIESHWRFNLYERSAGRISAGRRGGSCGRSRRSTLGSYGTSWGQVCKQPIYRLLGGPVRDRIAVYNSCGNSLLRARKRPAAIRAGRVMAALVREGTFVRQLQLVSSPPRRLAEELLAEGYNALKTWPFDAAAHRHGGMRISLADLEEETSARCARFANASGTKWRFLVDGHGFFSISLPASLADRRVAARNPSAVAGRHSQDRQSRYAGGFPGAIRHADLRQ